MVVFTTNTFGEEVEEKSEGSRRERKNKRGGANWTGGHNILQLMESLCSKVGCMHFEKALYLILVNTITKKKKPCRTQC